MKDEKEMLDLFQVEELEKRYEMAWGDNIGGVQVSPSGEPIPVKP